MKKLKKIEYPSDTTTEPETMVYNFNQHFEVIVNALNNIVEYLNGLEGKIKKQDKQ